MTDNQTQPVRHYQIIGTHLSQGVVSALRAYPSFLSATRSTSDGDEHLLVEVDINDKIMTAERLTDVITRAGGQVKSIQLLIS